MLCNLKSQATLSGFQVALWRQASGGVFSLPSLPSKCGLAPRGARPHLANLGEGREGREEALGAQNYAALLRGLHVCSMFDVVEVKPAGSAGAGE